MKHSITSNSRSRCISQICGVAVCAVVLLSLISCGSGGNGSGGSPSMGSTGSNVVTGTMPMTATASREPLSDKRSFFAQLWNFLTTEPVAYAMSKGRVEVVGTTIKAFPIGGGRFELIGVPDGPVTIRFTTPDGVTGTLTLNLPQGGGALVDLGTVIVKNDGRVEFRPSSTNARFSSVVKARGKVSGLVSPMPVVASDGTCPTFVVAGLTFCFDQNTLFDPPVTVATPFVNSDTTNNLIVDVVGEPTADPTSHVFHARRVHRNLGTPAAVNEKIKVLAPITRFGQDTMTLFGGTTGAPDAHAITFNTASAKFEPGALKQNLAIGLLVEVLAGPVSTDETGKQSSVASVVKLVRIHDERCSKGELLDVEGTISSLQPQSMTFGLNNDKLFVHIVDNVTRFDDPLTSFDSLKVGQLVEVTALPPQTTGGPLQAVEVDLEDALGNAAIEVRGAISSLDTTKGTFIVAGITFCYNCNTVTTQFKGLTATTLANGQFVEVNGTALSNGVSTALEVELETDLRPSSCSDDEGRDDENEQNQEDDDQQR
jgi:hypothetical protein